MEGKKNDPLTCFDIAQVALLHGSVTKLGSVLFVGDDFCPLQLLYGRQTLTVQQKNWVNNRKQEKKIRRWTLDPEESYEKHTWSQRTAKLALKLTQHHGSVWCWILTVDGMAGVFTHDMMKTYEELYKESIKNGLWLSFEWITSSNMSLAEKVWPDLPSIIQVPFEILLPEFEICIFPPLGAAAATRFQRAALRSVLTQCFMREHLGVNRKLPVSWQRCAESTT